MKKFKVEFTKTTTYVVDVLANTELQAVTKASKKFSKLNETEHYYQVGDLNVRMSNIYDVTNTDDPFNP